MRRPFYISALLLAAALAAVLGLSRRGQPVVVATNLEKLPHSIHGLQAVDDSFDPAVYEELNADCHVYRHYRDGQGRQVDLYIGYYGTAKGGRTPHNPYACLPGAGWSLLAASPVLLKGPAKGMQVNYVLARKNEMCQTMLHWYQTGGDRVLASGVSQNIWRFLGKVLHNRNDGAFVRVTVMSGPEELEKQLALASDFASEVQQLLPSYWPEEEDVY